MGLLRETTDQLRLEAEIELQCRDLGSIRPRDRPREIALVRHRLSPWGLRLGGSRCDARAMRRIPSHELRPSKDRRVVDVGAHPLTDRTSRRAAAMTRASPAMSRIATTPPRSIRSSSSYIASRDSRKRRKRWTWELISPGMTKRPVKIVHLGALRQDSRARRKHRPDPALLNQDRHAGRAHAASGVDESHARQGDRPRRRLRFGGWSRGRLGDSGANRQDEDHRGQQRQPQHPGA